MEWNLDSAEQMAEQLHWEAMNEPKIVNPYRKPAEPPDWKTPASVYVAAACGAMFWIVVAWLIHWAWRVL